MRLVIANSVIEVKTQRTEGTALVEKPTVCAEVFFDKGKKNEATLFAIKLERFMKEHLE